MSTPPDRIGKLSALYQRLSAHLEKEPAGAKTCALPDDLRQELDGERKLPSPVLPDVHPIDKLRQKIAIPWVIEALLISELRRDGISTHYSIESLGDVLSDLRSTHLRLIREHGLRAALPETSPTITADLQPRPVLNFELAPSHDPFPIGDERGTWRIKTEILQGPLLLELPSSQGQVEEQRTSASPSTTQSTTSAILKWDDQTDVLVAGDERGPFQIDGHLVASDILRVLHQRRGASVPIADLASEVDLLQSGRTERWKAKGHELLPRARGGRRRPSYSSLPADKARARLHAVLRSQIPNKAWRDRWLSWSSPHGDRGLTVMLRTDDQVASLEQGKKPQPTEGRCEPGT